MKNFFKFFSSHIVSLSTRIVLYFLSIVFLLLIGWVLSALFSVSKTKIVETMKGRELKKAQVEDKKTRTKEQEGHAELVEALVLEKECLTPCEVSIAWRFRIQSEGLPIKVTFKGVKEPVSYPGEGDFKAPKEMRSGDTLIESAVPERTTIPIKVYRRVYIRR
jgi:hypothetical protein